MPSRPPYDVRHARAADLRHIGPLEDSGAALFEEVLGDLTGTVLRSPAATGWERLDQPGFLLVSGPVGRPTGFAHVREIEGHAHLEQLSVAASSLRQGIGTALVRAAAAEARREGHRSMSLCTYRDLPWNAPFYAGLGFAEVPDAELLGFQRELRAHERAIGLEEHGVRLVMVTRLTP